MTIAILSCVLISWIFGLFLYQTSTNTLSFNDYITPIHPSTIHSTKPPDNLNIIYFIQISDIHTSIYKPTAITHLKHFIKNELSIISPVVVLVTGDLVDSKSYYRLSTHQYHQEWASYHALLNQSNILSTENFWYDLRGNHDCYDVSDFNHSSNLFKKFSASKQEGYSFTISRNFGNYSFLGIDGCPLYGSRGPFNFFGLIDNVDLDFINSKYSPFSNHTFIASHYPSGTTAKASSFNKVTNHVSLWLSGHLHNLVGGLGDTMYSNEPGKFLELELGDMKQNAMFRIIAVDNDKISFVDQTLHVNSDSNDNEYQHPPIILITSPKDGRFLIQSRESKTNLDEFNYIRILCWSVDSNLKFNMTIDGVQYPSDASYKGTGAPRVLPQSNVQDYIPLWIIPWDPKPFNDNNVHILKICAIDSKYLSGCHIVQFRYDGEVIPIEAGSGGFIISLDFQTLFKNIFFISYFTIICCLLIPMLILDNLNRKGKLNQWMGNISENVLANERSGNCVWLFFNRWILRMCTFAQTTTLFYPYIFYVIYIVTMPWFIGDFVPSKEDSGRWGLYFLYGIYFPNGTWLPILDTWAYSSYILLWSVLPFYFYLSCLCTPLERLYSSKHVNRKNPMHKRWYTIFVVVLAWLYASSDMIFMTFYYGIWATLLNPPRTWFLIWFAVTVIKYWSSKNGYLNLQNEDHELVEIEGMKDPVKSVLSNEYNLRSRSKSKERSIH